MWKTDSKQTVRFQPAPESYKIRKCNKETCKLGCKPIFAKELKAINPSISQNCSKATQQRRKKNIAKNKKPPICKATVKETTKPKIEAALSTKTTSTADLYKVRDPSELNTFEEFKTYHIAQMTPHITENLFTCCDSKSRDGKCCKHGKQKRSEKRKTEQLERENEGKKPIAGKSDDKEAKESDVGEQSKNKQHCKLKAATSEAEAPLQKSSAPFACCRRSKDSVNVEKCDKSKSSRKRSRSVFSCFQCKRKSDTRLSSSPGSADNMKQKYCSKCKHHKCRHHGGVRRRTEERTKVSRLAGCLTCGRKRPKSKKCQKGKQNLSCTEKKKGFFAKCFHCKSKDANTDSEKNKENEEIEEEKQKTIAEICPKMYKCWTKMQNILHPKQDKNEVKKSCQKDLLTTMRFFDNPSHIRIKHVQNLEEYNEELALEKEEAESGDQQSEASTCSQKQRTETPSTSSLEDFFVKLTKRIEAQKQAELQKKAELEKLAELKRQADLEKRKNAAAQHKKPTDSRAKQSKYSVKPTVRDNGRTINGRMNNGRANNGRRQPKQATNSARAAQKSQTQRVQLPVCV